MAFWGRPDTAPKDGTLLRLLVEPDEEAHTSFEDSEEPYETIGFNNLAGTGDDEWQFAGWDWSHDCITQGYGKVIGWREFSDDPVPARRQWFYPIVIPVTKEGNGPADLKDAEKLTWEVWDRELTSHASFDFLPDAIDDANRRNAELAKYQSTSAVQVTENEDLLRRLREAADGIEKVDLGRRSLRRGYENLLRKAHAALSQAQTPADVVDTVVDFFLGKDEAVPAPQPDAKAFDECAASGAGHSFGAHGPDGEIQCEYCGESPPTEAGVEEPEVKRYHFDSGNHTWGTDGGSMDEAEDGEWVKFSDHNTIVERLRHQVKALMAERTSLIETKREQIRLLTWGRDTEANRAVAAETALTTERERSARLREEIADLKHDIERAQNALSLEATARIEAEETGARLSRALNCIASLHMATTLGTHSRARYDLNRARSIARSALRGLKGGEA